MASQEYEKFYEGVFSKIPSNTKSIEEVRSKFEQWMAEYPSLSDLRIEPVSIGDRSASWILAPAASRKKIILFLHGGGFVAGSVEAHKNLIGRISAASEAAVLAISYRLAPENPFPAALEDALTAYRWLLHHPYPRSRIVILGASAGAGLALSLLLKLKMEKIAMPAGVVCLSPWVDLESFETESTPKDILSLSKLKWSAEVYANKESLKNPLISPIHGDFEGIPPIFIQTGTRDLLHTQALSLSKKMKQEGIETTLDIWPDMIHNWTLFAPEFPEAQKGIDRAAQFISNLIDVKA